MKPTLISVVIATYRRQAMLRDTVASLAALRVPEAVTLEVIIIDNDPEATAREAALELQPHYAAAFSLRYVHETRKGLSYARNRGIEESRGDIIAFLDDDVFVAEGWLEAILRCFEQTKADCVGGRTLIHWEGEPHPVLKACERRLVAIDLGEHDFEVCGSRLPGGGNAAFRRSVFDQGPRFATSLGRVGNVLLSGEDSEMFQRLRRDGRRIWYCAAGVVHHRTGGERLTLAYVARQKYWFGISSALIDRQTARAGPAVAARRGPPDQVGPGRGPPIPGGESSRQPPRGTARALFHVETSRVSPRYHPADSRRGAVRVTGQARIARRGPLPLTSEYPCGLNLSDPPT